MTFPTKEVMLSVIKEKGKCDATADMCMTKYKVSTCIQCPIYESIYYSNDVVVNEKYWTRRYNNACKLFIDNYGESELFEELL